MSDLNNSFRVIARYCYPWLESAKKFASYEEAKAELCDWKEKAKRDGYQMEGRIVKSEDAK